MSAARARGLPTPDAFALKTVLETPGALLEDAPPARIESLSLGYHGNGLGRLSYATDAPEVRLLGGPKKRRAPSAIGTKPKKRRAKYEDDY